MADHYRYRCDRCGISWPTRQTLEEVQSDRDEHHRTTHDPAPPRTGRRQVRPAVAALILIVAAAIWRWISGR
ncbi:hypothetical protein [Streptomyces noursei]|uniref:hypothetical protein n=1 Tax=Streptomyces noursei TaxID=1971 RepID=UPI0037F53050